MSSTSLRGFEPATSLPALDPEDIVTLRISGGKPIHLKRPELLAQCSSWTDGAAAWHELVLYRRETGDYAVGATMCRAEGGDVFHARLFPELDSALSWLEAFNPTADLGADIDASDRRISTTEIALRAAALRQNADRVEQQYRVMIGELLYRMEGGE
jgi:hypothetical protein